MNTQLLLILSLATPLVAERAAYAVLHARTQVHLATAQQAATAFGLNATDVAICPLLQDGPCPHSHKQAVVLHMAPQDLILAPSLVRYQIYLELYTQTAINQHPLITKKRFTRHLWQSARALSVWLFLVLGYTKD